MKVEEEKINETILLVIEKMVEVKKKTAALAQSRGRRMSVYRNLGLRRSGVFKSLVETAVHKINFLPDKGVEVCQKYFKEAIPGYKNDLKLKRLRAKLAGRLRMELHESVIFDEDSKNTSQKKSSKALNAEEKTKKKCLNEPEPEIFQFESKKRRFINLSDNEIKGKSKYNIFQSRREGSTQQYMLNSKLAGFAEKSQKRVNLARNKRFSHRLESDEQLFHPDFKRSNTNFVREELSSFTGRLEMNLDSDEEEEKSKEGVRNQHKIGGKLSTGALDQLAEEMNDSEKDEEESSRKRMFSSFFGFRFFNDNIKHLKERKHVIQAREFQSQQSSFSKKWQKSNFQKNQKNGFKHETGPKDSSRRHRQGHNNGREFSELGDDHDNAILCTAGDEEVYDEDSDQNEEEKALDSSRHGGILKATGSKDITFLNLPESHRPLNTIKEESEAEEEQESHNSSNQNKINANLGGMIHESQPPPQNSLKMGVNLADVTEEAENDSSDSDIWEDVIKIEEKPSTVSGDLLRDEFIMQEKIHINNFDSTKFMRMRENKSPTSILIKNVRLAPSKQRYDSLFEILVSEEINGIILQREDNDSFLSAVDEQSESSSDETESSSSYDTMVTSSESEDKFGEATQTECNQEVKIKKNGIFSGENGCLSILYFWQFLQKKLKMCLFFNFFRMTIFSKIS